MPSKREKGNPLQTHAHMMQQMKCHPAFSIFCCLPSDSRLQLQQSEVTCDEGLIGVWVQGVQEQVENELRYATEVRGVFSTPLSFLISVYATEVTRQ